VTLGGFVQGQAEFGNVPDARYTGIEDRFLLRRARVNLSGLVTENFDFRVEVDFGANSLSEKTGYSGQFTDVYLNWNRYSFANLKFGQFKTPFGYEQLVADPKLLTIERSLSNDRLTDSRQIGLGAAGDFLKKRLGYSAGIFNGSGVNNSFNDNPRFMAVGRLTGVPIEGTLAKQPVRWAVGVNALATHDNGISKGGFGFDSTTNTAARDNLFTGDRTSWGVDTQFKWGQFGAEAEFLRTRFEPSNAFPRSTLDAQGWYAMLTYFIVPSKLQFLAKYEQFDPNLDTSGNTSSTYTLGLTYYVKGDSLKFAVNYLLGSPRAGLQDNQSRLLTRFQFCF